MSLSLMMALTADRDARHHSARMMNVIPQRALRETEAAEPAFVEFTQFRTFTFDSSEDAAAMFLKVSGDDAVPARLNMRECELIVDEVNGEAVMTMIRSAGLEFTYDRAFLPVYEIWG